MIAVAYDGQKDIIRLLVTELVLAHHPTGKKSLRSKSKEHMQYMENAKTINR